ncbi:MAG: hypothetical protein WDZ45_07965 [Flavobacteriaceae bacterium]
MKNLMLIVLASIIAIACSKKGDDISENYPGVLNLYIDLKKSDGTPFEEGEISSFQEYEFNGEYAGGSIEWLVLEKRLKESLGQEPYFGPCIDYMFGWESGEEPDHGSQWVNKIYLYLKYMNTEIIDTIMLRDSANYPEYRHYNLYLNGEEIEYSTAPNNIEWLITITKEEF